MRRIFWAIASTWVALCFLVPMVAFGVGDDAPSRPADPGQEGERTCFQTHAVWGPKLQVRSDVAICYGIDATLPDRISQWKKQGYIPHLMTGVSWGDYQDYLYGRFDGVNHVDEAQTDRYGQVISHGGDVYYMSPGENYGKFLCQGVKRAMDAGAEAIHLEEPEFWARAGYSAGFQREWKAYYHEDWIAPHISPDAQYRASQLKYYLYRRALKQVFDFVKEENARTGRHVRCYVPTHSLINYAQWRIVSPESSLIQVGADGFIAQTWTGTARTPNVYEGKQRERTFESAFLEYGAMMNVVRASGGTVWFLNDPIEDDPDHSWEDYRANWESTLTASLLWPQVWRYEVMPWPERIYHGQYPKVDRAHRKPGEAVVREPLPAAYGTELMTVITALNEMNQKEVAWNCGTQGIGVVVSDSMMFQRAGPSQSDTHLGSFFGLALPLVKHGVPAEPVQLENATAPGALAPYRLLLMTYEGMKPMTPDVHTAIAEWVKQGGVLVFLGDDSDPYNNVHAWWNEKNKGVFYKSPREHLFEQLGLAKGAPAGQHEVGKGFVLYDTSSPAALTYQSGGAKTIRSLVERACKAIDFPYRETNHLVLRRGPYVIAAGLDESITADPLVLTGPFIDLFDAGLAVRTEVKLLPGARHLLLDLDHVAAPRPVVLASACKVLGPQVANDGAFSFHAEGPEGINAVACIGLKAAPTAIELDGKPHRDSTWNEALKMLIVRFPNSAAGHVVTVR